MSSVPTLEVLYARYSRSVFRRASVLLADPDAARDAMQEVFLRAMTRDGLGPDTENPMGWLYRVTTNLCLNRLRDSRRRTRLLSDAGGEEARDGSADARAVVRNILERVPEDLQEAAIYYYVDELSHDEIARIVGVSRRTIGNRLQAFHERVGELSASEVWSG